MMQRCILVVALFALISCKKSDGNNALPILLNLEIVDSIKLEEKDYFLNGQFHVKIIGDSLLGVSSVKSPSVAFYHVNGKQRKRIASGDYPVGSFLPSYFDASEYPIVYLLDKRSQSILKFNVEKQELLEKIKLQFPDDKEIKIMGSKFQKLPIGFLVELGSANYEQMNPKHYREGGKLIYLFDDLGQMKDKPFLEYPDQIKDVEGSLRAIDYLNLTSNRKSLYFTFAHAQKIIKYDAFDFGKLLKEIPLPQSRYFNYQLKGAEEIYSFEEMEKNGERKKVNIPSNHYFNSIHETDKSILIQTWMNNQEKDKKSITISHVLVYDKEKETWSETSNPRNILDIGMLAGVVNDTLYFYEGSLMKSDEKYIKRAVLKPIKE